MAAADRPQPNAPVGADQQAGDDQPPHEFRLTGGCQNLLQATADENDDRQRQQRPHNPMRQHIRRRDTAEQAEIERCQPPTAEGEKRIEIACGGRRGGGGHRAPNTALSDDPSRALSKSFLRNLRGCLGVSRKGSATESVPPDRSQSALRAGAPCWHPHTQGRR